MGKSVGFLGPVSGKVGNTVGYVLKDSPEKQGWRVYQPNVDNPQSDAQMRQRIRLTAINNELRALKDIIERGFEGVDYGDASLRAWRKIAMGQAFNGPWLLKGNKTPVPIKDVPITVGSLPQITSQYDGGDYVTNVSHVSGSGLGVFSAELIAQGLAQEGDQVTFVWATYLNDTLIWHNWSFYVNPSSQGDFDGGIMVKSNAQYWTFYNDETNMYALAIAVSRPGSHLRSTTYITLNPVVVTLWYAIGSVFYNAVVNSYRSGSGAAVTNWELDTDAPPLSADAGSDAQLDNWSEDQIVRIVSITVKDGYTVAVGDDDALYWMHCSDERSTAYDKWFGDDQRWKSTAPTGHTAANTVRVVYSADGSDIDHAFVQWLIDDMGVSYVELISV